MDTPTGKQHWAEAVVECVTDEAEQERLIRLYDQDELVKACLALGKLVRAARSDLSAALSRERVLREAGDRLVSMLYQDLSLTMGQWELVDAFRDAIGHSPPDEHISAALGHSTADEPGAGADALRAHAERLAARPRGVHIPVELWDQFVADYCRYVDGDTKMDWQTLRISLAEVIAAAAPEERHE